MTWHQAGWLIPTFYVCMFAVFLCALWLNGDLR